MESLPWASRNPILVKELELAVVNSIPVRAMPACHDALTCVARLNWKAGIPSVTKVGKKYLSRNEGLRPIPWRFENSWVLHSCAE
jgi:hypothetical protein